MVGRIGSLGEEFLGCFHSQQQGSSIINTGFRGIIIPRFILGVEGIFFLLSEESIFDVIASAFARVLVLFLFLLGFLILFGFL